MAQQIGAHFTLCHSLSDDLLAALQELPTAQRLRVRVGRAQHWGEPSAGIFLGVDDHDGTIQALREQIGIEDPVDAPFHPHVTLTHPRTTPSATAAEAWAALRTWRVDADITLGSIAVIEHDGTAWQTVGVIDLWPNT